MNINEFYKISGYPQPSDKFEMLAKQFDQFDMMDFAYKYVKKIQLSDILKAKKQNQREYKKDILSFLKSLNFDGIEFEDWELVLIRLEIDRLKQLSWLPKSIHFNSINNFQSL
jgi:hypothetical protein